MLEEQRDEHHLIIINSLNFNKCGRTSHGRLMTETIRSKRALMISKKPIQMKCQPGPPMCGEHKKMKKSITNRKKTRCLLSGGLRRTRCNLNKMMRLKKV